MQIATIVFLCIAIALQQYLHSLHVKALQLCIRQRDEYIEKVLAEWHKAVALALEGNRLLAVMTKIATWRESSRDCAGRN